jgi:type VI secretion system secreted protein Hcp
MAFEFHVAAKGAKQGQFKGDGLPDKDKIVGLGFSGGVSLASATGQLSGRRQYSPIVFTKPWGPSSPQFIQALINNEQLSSVVFEFLRTTPEGVESVHYRVTLTGATVVGVQQSAGNLLSRTPACPELDEISLNFRKIVIEDVASKTQVSDDGSVS